MWRFPYGESISRVDTVQAQGWSFVERERAFAEFIIEAAKKCGERATFELAMSRISRVRRSLRTQTIRSLQLSRVGTVDAERIQGQTQKLQGQTHGLSGCAHARNAVKESCIYGIVGHVERIYIEKSRQLHD